MVKPSFNIPPPDCLPTQFVEDKDNTISKYSWTLPNSQIEPCIANGTCNCAIRIRYNITSDESSGVTGTFLDSRNNSAVLDYPNVHVEEGVLSLAVAASYYGRVFQDRSYTFHILPRPTNLTNKIYNLNVRGKRGNVVQAFPALEYGFSPKYLQVEQGDFIHFQWTGSDFNSGAFQGQGTPSTDRSNIVQIESMNKNFPISSSSNVYLCNVCPQVIIGKL